MPATSDHRRILDQAVDRLGQLLRAEIEVEREARVKDERAAAIITARRDGRALRFVAQIKPRLTRGELGAAVHSMRGLGPEGLLVTPYVNPRLAEELHGARVQFVDCAGNAYVDAQGVYVFVYGHRPEQPPARVQTQQLRPATVQVGLTLLCAPELVRRSLRDMAKVAGVALGTAKGAVDELREQGHIAAGPGRTRRLVLKERMLDRCVAGYVERVRPRQILDVYRAEAGWWRDVALPQGLAWGGEVAAFLKTGHMRPEAATLYGERLPPEMIIDHRFTKDPLGSVELVRPFWGFDYVDPDGPIVHPIIVYADLLATGGKRNTETAEVIRERFVAGHIGQD